MRLIPAALCLGLACLTLASPTRAERASDGSAPLPLSEERGKGDRAGKLLFRGGLHLKSPSAAFGGLSALRVSPDGSQFVALTDRGAVVNGRLRYGRDGSLAGAGDYQMRPLLGPGGAPLPATGKDSEGLAMLGPWPGDGWVVSFERKHRLVRYPSPLGGVGGTELPGPPGLADLPGNSGLETLAALPTGDLLALAEEDGGEGRHRGWVGRPGTWAAITYQARPPFLSVDAAALPDGDVLVLERRASWIGGWGSRIVRVAAADLARVRSEGGVLEGTELARLDPPLLVENFEGIDVRQGPGGSLYVYLLSDDNFSLLQRSVLLMFELPPG